MFRKFTTGVITGNIVKNLFEDAKKEKVAIPAVNVVGSNTINATLETASEIKSPIIIQFANGGAIFNAGKLFTLKNQKAAIKGAVAGAKHIHELAKLYGSTVILHTDHCTKPLIPWLNGLLNINEKYYKIYKKTLFSSHLLDLSSENLQKNIEISSKYFSRMKKINMLIELGITGGEEDEVNNLKLYKTKFYTKPEDVAFAFEKLLNISPNFIIAASFGNVHTVYKSVNRILYPKILYYSQQYIQNKYKTSTNPICFVFTGGTGSYLQKIHESIHYGVVKMNIDTQYAFMLGVRNYIDKKKEYLKTQLGNPTGKNNPNKNFYDTIIWLREGELKFKNHLKKIFMKLNNIHTLY